MVINKLLVFFIVFFLLVIDWLTFHDFFEPHTTRDWLTLLASVFVFFYFTRRFLQQAK